MKTFSQTLLQKSLLILAIIWSNISFAQIPNWNMESWTTITTDVPTPWLTYGITTKVSPGQNGSYAVKLQGSNNGPGAILYGTPGNNTFDGGTTFAARPDSMIAFFKYNIAAGDSAWVIISFKKNGVPISNDLYEFTGSNSSTFQRMAFKNHFVNSSTPDTVFVGITSTNPNGKTINTTSWVIVDNISFSGTTVNVPNPDFENWTTQTTYTPDGWMVENRLIGNSVSRATDAYAGNYAMKLQTIFASNGDTTQGYTQTGTNINNNNWGWRPTFAVSSTPNSLNGFYKFIPQNNDTFTINIGLFKNGMNVGGAYYKSSATLNTYTPISVPIYYNNTPPIAPDSAIIAFSTFMMNQYNSFPRGQSVAFIDNLSFDQYIYAGIPGAIQQIRNLTIYPNPAEVKLNVKFDLMQKEKVIISIYDLKGCEVMKLSEQYFDIGKHELNFNIEQLSSGIYFMVTQSETSLSHSKLVITK